MNFDGLESLVIPEGNVVDIRRGSEVLWQKVVSAYTPRLEITYTWSSRPGPLQADVKLIVYGMKHSAIKHVDIGQMDETNYKMISYVCGKPNSIDSRTHVYTDMQMCFTVAAFFFADVTYEDTDGSVKTITITTPIVEP